MFNLVMNNLFYLAIKISQIQVTIPTDSQLSSYIISDVYYILKLSGNFLFVLTLGQCKYKLEFIKSRCQLINSGKVIAIAYQKENMYILNTFFFTSKYAYIITNYTDISYSS